MRKPSSITPQMREAILNGWAAGRTGTELAAEVGTSPTRALQIVSAARRRGDPRAVRRNRGSAWRPEPVSYTSSKAFLDAALARVRERSEAWESSEMGRRMQAVAVPPPDER